MAVVIDDRHLSGVPVIQFARGLILQQKIVVYKGFHSVFI
jgi:hypothetical protein